MESESGKRPASGPAEGDASKRVRTEESAPSKVLHMRNLPHDVVDTDVYNLIPDPAKLVSYLMLKPKGQAFLQMTDEAAAAEVLEHHSSQRVTLRGRQVYPQYSRREELESGVDARSSGQGCIAYLTLFNSLVPVTLDHLYTFFSNYGTILKIILFTKNFEGQVTMNALLQFNDAPAVEKILSLNNQSFGDFGVLRVQRSNLTTLNVKFNNDRSRDFTNPTLPTGGSESAQSGPYIPPPPPANAAPFTQPGGMPSAAHSAVGASVVHVGHLNPDYVNPDTLFALFGVYGDVHRVKILFNKRDTALVQMATPSQAQTAIKMLNGCPLHGSALHVSLSTHPVIKMPKPDAPDPNNCTKDYSSSPYHRYKIMGSKNYQNICPPSKTLHVSNIPDNVGEDVIRNAFGRYGTVSNFRYFKNNEKMALVEMSNLGEAVIALIACHQLNIRNSENDADRIRVSFSKTVL